MIARMLSRTRVREALRIAALLGPSALAGTSALEGQQNALWYISTYTRDVLVWDEASEQVIARIETGSPIQRTIQPNEARTRLYVHDASAQVVEIVDVAQRRVVDSFTLSDGNVTVRIAGFQPHPSDERAVMSVKRYTKLIDRYVVEGPFILEYDIRAKQVTDTIPWPDGQERENVNFRYSPDGATLYFFVDDIIAVDAETYEEIDRWAISEPLEPGLGRANFGTNSGTYDDPGVSTSFYRMTDPAQNRSMLGIARVRLADREVDFYTLGTNESVGNFTLAPGGEKAYALYTEIGRYEFWELDLVGRRLARRQPFEGRPRMSLGVSADGRKLYIYGAGNTIEVHDALTFEHLRSVTLDEDMRNAVIIPAGSGTEP